MTIAISGESAKVILTSKSKTASELQIRHVQWSAWPCSSMFTTFYCHEAQNLSFCFLVPLLHFLLFTASKKLWNLICMMFVIILLLFELQPWFKKSQASLDYSLDLVSGSSPSNFHAGSCAIRPVHIEEALPGAVKPQAQSSSMQWGNMGNPKAMTVSIRKDSVWGFGPSVETAWAMRKQNAALKASATKLKGVNGLKGVNDAECWKCFQSEIVTSKLRAPLPKTILSVVTMGYHGH